MTTAAHGFEASRRRDRGQAGDGADADTDETRFSLELPLDEHPDEQSYGGADLRVDQRVGGTESEPKADPPLKPNQPNQRRAVPNATYGTLCGVVSTGWPSSFRDWVGP